LESEIMTIIQAMLLGAVQGVAEFLPISSSGHLAIAEELLGLAEVPLLFDILLHVATLASVCIVFRARIAELFGVLWRVITRSSPDSDRNDRTIIVALIVATAMTGIVGLAIKDFVESFSPFMISICLAVTGVLLFASGRYEPKTTRAFPGAAQGFVIGIAQGIGVTPGISRSGATISASLLTGVNRKAAGEFSFLLSIPAILAAFILELKDADTLSGAVSAAPLAVGMITAFAVGYVSLKFLLGLINRGRLGWFALYLVPAGIALAIHFAGVF
jgi:undecaprenyl-diphosphatase